MKYPCPNKACPNYGHQCWTCCNTCGKDIVWRPPLLDLDIVYKGPKPLNPDGTVHHCMLDGVTDGEYRNMSRLYPRRKACVILCPYPKCTEAIVDEPPDYELLDRFRDHLMVAHKHRLKESIGVSIYDKKTHIQDNNKISYTDPFLYVSMDEISQ